jgi:hypothetical protein
MEWKYLNINPEDRTAKWRCRKVIEFYSMNPLVLEEFEKRLFLPHLKSGQFEGFKKVFNLTFLSTIVTCLPLPFIKSIAKLLGDDSSQNSMIIKELKNFMERDIFLKLVKEYKLNINEAQSKIPNVRLNIISCKY